MGKDFHNAFAEARDVYERASQALGLDLEALCFGEDPRLGLTEYQQPAILTTEIAMLQVLRSRFGLEPTCWGGHSLGEYTAMVAASVIPLEEAVVLVRERGRLIQDLVPPEQGGMVAVMARDLDLDALHETLAGLELDVANYNSSSQVVLSGRVAEVERAGERIREHPALCRARIVSLNVSAPFHSRLMSAASDRFRPLLEKSSLHWRVELAGTVVSNFGGGFHLPQREALTTALAEQLCSPVRWIDNMKALIANSEAIVEIGPARPLRAFFASLGVRATTVTTAREAATEFANPRTT